MKVAEPYIYHLEHLKEFQIYNNLPTNDNTYIL